MSISTLRGFPAKSLGSSSPSFLDRSKAYFGSSTKSNVYFDHELWWAENGYIVRHLLEGRDSGDECANFSDGGNDSSLSTIRLRNCFEQVYASDATYQDLFIDTPPCRDTLKLSFHLINRYWEIQVTKLDPPILMKSFPCYHIEKKDKNENRNKGVEAVVTTEPIGDNIFLRVPYTVTQRPRFFSLSSTMLKRFPLLPMLQWKILEYEYEGWIDLYLRPTGSPEPQIENFDGSSIGSTNMGNRHIITISDNDCNVGKNGDWEVYRHDDRFRVFPPRFLHRYIGGVDETGGDIIDALSIIERIPLVCTIFQRFRWVHGRLLHYFSKIEYQSKG